MIVLRPDQIESYVVMDVRMIGVRREISRWCRDNGIIPHADLLWSDSEMKRVVTVSFQNDFDEAKFKLMWS